MMAVAGALVAIVFSVVGYSKSSSAIEHVDRERQQSETDRLVARDQSCMLNERDHLQDVQELRRTYDRLPEALEFYDQVAPTEGFRVFLRQAVEADVRRLEKEARVDRAPEVCDEPGFGLPEPDPVIPERPPGALP